MKPLIVIRGGGDLASGVALRLFHTGYQVVMLELEKPLAVRRTVAFAEAVYEGTHEIEGVNGRLVSPDQLMVSIESGEVPVLIDPGANILRNQFLTSPRSTFLIDGRLLKNAPEALDVKPSLNIGLGPGFTAGENCDAVIETRRGHTLGRVYWEGSTAPDTGKPEGDERRVLRAAGAGTVVSHMSIGEHLQEGQLIAEVQASGGEKTRVESPFKGVLRGLIRPGIEVEAGTKLGDVDERDDSSMCFLVSDKALAVGGGVLEAILIKQKQLEIEQPDL